MFLEVLYLLKDAFEQKFLVADAKPGRRAGILSSVNLIIRTKLISLEALHKLRGKASHLASTNFGRRLCTHTWTNQSARFAVSLDS